MTARATAERVGHARHRLATDANVWVATAANGDPHLVPLSLAWIDDRIVVATPADTPTARNGAATGLARAALDSADDVVIFDTSVEVVSYRAAPADLRSRYVERVGWDPGDNPGEWVLLVMTPTRGQAWNGPGEIAGRTIVRDGAWLGAGED